MNDWVCRCVNMFVAVKNKCCMQRQALICLAMKGKQISENCLAVKLESDGSRFVVHTSLVIIKNGFFPQVDIFKVNTPCDIGDLLKVHVCHDNSGSSSAWLLDHIEVCRCLKQGYGPAVVFPCQQWLAENKGDSSMSIDLLPDKTATPGLAKPLDVDEILRKEGIEVDDYDEESFEAEEDKEEEDSEDDSFEDDEEDDEFEEEDEEDDVKADERT